MKSLYVIPNILNRNLLESIKSLSVCYLYTTCCDCVFCKKKSVIDLYINMLRFTGSPWISRISLTLIVDNNHNKVDRWICLSQTVLLTVKFCTFHKRSCDIPSSTSLLSSVHYMLTIFTFYRFNSELTEVWLV